MMNIQTAPADDTRGEIDLNPTMLIEQVDSWLDGFIRLLPNIVVAITLVIIAYIVGAVLKSSITGYYKKRERYDLGKMLGGIAKWSLLLTATLFALTIVLPNLSPSSLFAGLGVSSVAIGFAFKDILQNWLAGLLILLRQPFEVGDQIVAQDYEGTVQHIETRSTIIKTYDGMHAIIPNSEIYTNAVLVKTAREKRRSQYDIGIGYGDDPDAAREKLLSMLQGIQNIESDPEPQVLMWDLAASWVTLRLRWWTDTRRADVVAVRSQIIEGIKKTLDDAGIDMPYDTVVNLFHDQTDEYDGIRGKQREGWPARSDNDRPKPVWKAKQSGASENAKREKENA
ncbi:MAG: mechanosensitive ion channel family protein [Pseudomonadota bacterium]